MSPDSDFIGWMSTIGDIDDPERALRALKSHRANEAVLSDATRHLQHCLEALSSNEELVLDAIIAIAAVAELRANVARGILERLCAAARQRLLEDGTLPFVEEHFSLAALRALEQPTGRFSLVTVYEEYENLIARVTDQTLPAVKRANLMKKTVHRYRRALEHVLFDKPSQSESEPEQMETNSNTPLYVSDGDLPEPAPSVENLLYRFKPLAQNFPSNARPLQPKGAAISNRASSDMIRLDDFGPTGDDVFMADEARLNRPPWVRKALIAISTIGGFGALMVLMLGFVHFALLVIAGIALAASSMLIHGDRTVQWVFGWLGFVFAGVSLLVTPSMVASLPQSIDAMLFLVSGFLCLVIGGTLFHPAIRAHFGATALLEDEFD